MNKHEFLNTCDIVNTSDYVAIGYEVIWNVRNLPTHITIKNQNLWLKSYCC